jgi:hypothetical protein
MVTSKLPTAKKSYVSFNSLYRELCKNVYE